ncbi:Uncharacterized protein APZ42_024843 [Daphnia magna]|uniref:Uncharacterized protein n=1 Tax=Daphnia magna TaxID=35525 RepID=A0A164TR67_9CRUS|nr:Uncharacterized protein APZ42_024843 [Daphnia magna]
MFEKLIQLLTDRFSSNSLLVDFGCSEDRRMMRDWASTPPRRYEELMWREAVAEKMFFKTIIYFTFCKSYFSLFILIKSESKEKCSTYYFQCSQIGCICFSSRTSVSAAAVSPPRSWRQQQTVETLLRFPFINFLANPCGFMAASSTMNPTQPSWPGIATERPVNQFDSNVQQATPAPLRTLDTNATLEQQTLGFLGPLRDRYANRNYTSEERSALTQEFKLVVLEAMHLARHIYPPTGLHQCDGIQLQSLPNDDQLVSSTGEIQLEEVYRGMMITAAHLHLMIRDAYDSARFCPSENHAQHQNIRQLTGKVETSMCLILHSAIGAEDYDNLNFFRVAREVLKSNVHRYYDCSAREIRGCLVVRFADRIFGGIQRALFYTEAPQTSTAPYVAEQSS